MSTRLAYHCAARTRRQGRQDGRRDIALRYATWYVTHTCIVSRLKDAPRLPDVLLHGARVQRRNDLDSGAEVWPVKPTRLHLDMLGRRFRVCDGNQRIRCRGEAHLRGEQPIYVYQHIRVRHHRDMLHPRANELLQQGVRYVLDKRVGSPSYAITHIDPFLA